ncbi:MAG TPA: FAD-linked oxidase C-terminal domain-containing protein [Syntrophales bacterium]|nr:FAD-linked oxidase C-terminal domain-containing protein [Syntrophales bacterium]HPX12287.1 FAD-linked oxidase C-terminal domain-containing protein [Syntrophales bacterium]HQB29824.1 FAD-linked oxidase C-terminal domain-containing protein [Syntrophales bacterium]HQN78307.1 FAD-linked oxidase C-terminal domain-containing protein [Syntrophales bacterium]HQQ27188.1 FAD-linked oxidase C-terminal domain-containing protein [Syntrophales bacterium]
MTFFPPLTESAVAEIRRLVPPERLIDTRERLEPFSRDAGEEQFFPEMVVEAVSPEEVQAVLRAANRHRFPVTPRGLGTGLAGGAVPLRGGVVLSLAKMNRILSLERDNLLAVVEPGVVTGDLKRAALEAGLFYPPDPASVDTCSIGGNAATNAGGTSCVKYGTTRDYILGLEAVLPTGERVRAGVRTRKGVVGYDLVHLLVGSEGTLGVITRLYIKLIPLPGAVATAVAFFTDLPTAMEAVQAVMEGGYLPSAIEFLDRACLELVGDLLPFPEAKTAGAFLLVETDGRPGSISGEIEEIGTICSEKGAFEVLLAPDSRKRDRLWEIRREVALRIEHHAAFQMPEDVVVPIGKIAALVACLPEYEKAYGMKIYAFGHAGDGNIHLIVTAEHRDRRERVIAGVRALLGKVLSLGGTMSGEHGIGAAKSRFLSLELSPESIRIQKGIKDLLDPLGILNPGKIFPPEGRPGSGREERP